MQLNKKDKFYDISDPQQYIVTLTLEQRTAILRTFDYGLRTMDAETIEILDAVIRELKYAIHP